MGNARKNGAFGLVIIAVLGLMGLMASGAQASEKAWLVLGADIAANQTVQLSTQTEFNLKIEKETNLEILCAVIEAEDLLLIKGTTEAKGKIKYTTCKTWQGGKDISANCKPTEPITFGIVSLLILHAGKAYLLLHPGEAGGNFGQVKFKSPCALPETNNIKGSVVHECAHLKMGVVLGESCTAERVLHLLLPAPAGLFPADPLTYAGKSAILSGVPSVVLVAGEPWSGVV
jgi:hypothetical protein